jgi:site-specific recombinase XerD
LDDPGPAAEWAPRSAAKYAAGYGRWLSFLDGRGWLDPDVSPGQRVTRERVAAYLEELQGRNGTYTVVCRLEELAAALRALAPAEDWRWLLRRAAGLRRDAVPARAKRSRLRPAAELFALGTTLMAEADAADQLVEAERAAQYRDGLLIALLAARPLRLSNLAALALDRHLVRTSDGFMLRIAPTETKNHRPIEAPLPAALVPFVERYLTIHRPRLLLGTGRRGPGSAREALWVSRSGGAMAQSSIRTRIYRRTVTAFGTPLAPHLFRDAAATSLALETPAHVGSTGVILGHADLRTGERHYNQARAVEASRAYQDALARRRDG